MEGDMQPQGTADPAGIVRGEQLSDSVGTDQSFAACPTCGRDPEHAAPAESFVYAVGKIVPRFPNLSIEKEFAQVSAQSDGTGLTDRAVLHEALSRNRYLARSMCWVFAIEGLETYILQPRDPADIELLVEAVRPAPSRLDVDIVIGTRGPIAPPALCNGLMLPLVAIDQVYSFDRDSLIKSIPKPGKANAKEFTATAAEVFDRVTQIADNAGATDEHRALNYCVVRYPAIYTATAEAHQRNASLSGLEVRASRLSGARRVVDVILSFTNRSTDVTEKYFTRVDVTEKFPFLVTKLSPYFDR